MSHIILTFRGVWLLLLAIGSHKFIIALCIGQQLVTNRVNKCLVIIYIATFSLTTILGAGAGQSEHFMSNNHHNITCHRSGDAPLRL